MKTLNIRMSPRQLDRIEQLRVYLGVMEGTGKPVPVARVFRWALRLGWRRLLRAARAERRRAKKGGGS